MLLRMTMADPTTSSATPPAAVPIPGMAEISLFRAEFRAESTTGPISFWKTPIPVIAPRAPFSTHPVAFPTKSIKKVSFSSAQMPFTTDSMLKLQTRGKRPSARIYSTPYTANSII